jgi:hypothetical protein
MNIYEKVRRARKHYRKDPVRIENMLRKEIEASLEKNVLWASLIFDSDIEFMTFGERKALKTATNHKVTCYLVTGTGICPLTTDVS